MKGIQCYKINDKKDIDVLFQWIWLNLHNDIVAHWKIDCQKAL